MSTRQRSLLVHNATVVTRYSSDFFRSGFLARALQIFKGAAKKKKKCSCECGKRVLTGFRDRKSIYTAAGL